MEKDVLFLLLGAILGAVLGNIDKIIVFINKQINRWTIFHRNKLMKGLDVNKWLIEYYEKNKSSDELYNCKIGDFEVKIPFFSKPLWQFTESIDEDKNDLLVYSETINHFRVDKKIIEYRKKFGLELFDEPTLYLDRIETKQNKCILHAKKCSYYEMVSNMFSLEEETIRAASKKIKKTPIRDDFFRTINCCEKILKKPFSLGCTTSFVVKSQDSWEIALHRRSNRTVTYGNKLAVIPNFGLSLPKSDSATLIEEKNILLYNFVKEYCEEIFNYEEIIQLAKTNHNDPYWLFSLNESVELMNMLKDGRAELQFLGFGFDLYNGTANIAMAAIISDLTFAEKLKQNIKVNWEVKKEENISPIVFVDYRDTQLKEWFKRNEYQAGSAFTIAKTIEYLENYRI